MPTDTMSRKQLRDAIVEAYDETPTEVDHEVMRIVRARMSNQGGAIKAEWDETTQTPTIKHITPQELYKDRE